MRLLKLILGVALVAAVVTMWSERDLVTSAYTDDSDPIELRLEGIDLATARTPIEPSPFVLVASPDLRTSAVQPVAFVEPVAEKTELGGGKAALSGNVTGPDGPAVGATVRLERHTTAGITSTETFTDASGNWSATGLAGGRWRVRTFVPNLYTSGPAQVFFLAEDDALAVNTAVTTPSLAPVVDLVGPDETFIDTQHTYAVTVGVRRVDAEGRVVVLPMPGAQVNVVATSSSLVSAETVSTDAGGAARFALRCASLGSPTMSVTVSVGSVVHSSGLSLGRCVALPPPPEPEATDVEPDPTEDESSGESTPDASNDEDNQNAEAGTG